MFSVKSAKKSRLVPVVKLLRLPPHGRQDGLERIAPRSGRTAECFPEVVFPDMLNDRSNGAPLLPPTQEAPLARFPELVHDLDVARSFTAACATAQVEAGLLRGHPADARCLFQPRLTRMPAAGGAGEHLHTAEPVRLRGGLQSRFHPGFATLADLALGDAFGLRFVHRAKAFPVRGVLQGAFKYLALSLNCRAVASPEHRIT